MRFWNKNLRAREHWTKVKCPLNLVFQGKTFAILSDHDRVTAAIRWCQKRPERTRFYRDNDGWWYFEDSKDATWFILNWSN
jgi:hypothetical protein